MREELVIMEARAIEAEGQVKQMQEERIKYRVKMSDLNNVLDNEMGKRK